MRVIAGRFAGIPLQTPRSGTRPTTDRTKEAIFSHLDAEGILAPDSRVLDLFAGTGALGFEALSRGADHAVFVDRSPQAIRLLKRAVSLLHHHPHWDPTTMSADVIRSDAGKAVQRLARELHTPVSSDVSSESHVLAQSRHRAFDVIFLDPPYALPSSDLAHIISDLAADDLVAHEGELVIERSTRSQPISLPAGWEASKIRHYGETSIVYAYRS